MQKIKSSFISILLVVLVLCLSLTQINSYSVGKPSFAVVPPGNCQFGEEWCKVPLKKVERVSKDTKVLTFATPDESKPLNLPTCACLLAQGGCDNENNSFIRPYTPVSTNNMIGEFELMVKIYPDGNLSKHMDSMKVGDTLDFKHIKFNVKKQYPFGNKHICMLVGGTGITPMVQALHAILGNGDDKETKVVMLYGSQRADEILCEEVLDQWQKLYPDQLSVTHVMSNQPKWYKNLIGGTFRFVKKVISKVPLLPVKPPAGSSWKGDCGFITKEMIRDKFPGPKEDVNVFVCGPPPMYNALCGPREEEEVSGVLADIGYSQDQVTKF